MADKITELVSLFSQLRETGFIPTVSLPDVHEESMPYYFIITIEKLNDVFSYMLRQNLKMEPWTFRVKQNVGARSMFYLYFTDEVDCVRIRLLC